jgi:aminopeptidase
MTDAAAAQTPPDADLAGAAAVLVRAPVRGRSGECLVNAHDTFVLVADADSMGIALEVARAARDRGASPEIVRLDDRTSLPPGARSARPRKVLPTSVRRALGRAQSMAYIASAPARERSMREQLTGLVATLKARYAYLPDITARAFVNGMRLDYKVVAGAGAALASQLDVARTIVTESPAGTKLRLDLAPNTRWIPRLGEILPGRSVAFPAGALFTTPAEVEGTFVADASVGEFFGAREGLLREKAVRFTVAGGRVVRVETPVAELQRDLEATLALSTNSNRVGLVALGVNEGVGGPTGDATVDCNMPGLHVFFGDPASRATGASWSARASFSACQAGSWVLVNGRPIVEAGRITGR